MGVVALFHRRLQPLTVSAAGFRTDWHKTAGFCPDKARRSTAICGWWQARSAGVPASKETPMTAVDDFLGVVDKVLIDIEDIKRRTDQHQAKDVSSAGPGDFEFRPLTEEEKEEFVNSLNEEGKRILVELAPRAKK
jgi:hypothetical protein